VVAVALGAALAAAMAAVPRSALALQDSEQAAALRGAGDTLANAGSAVTQPPADSSAQGILDADADQDGVPDFMDGCPGTPVGTPVDRYGCPADEARVLLLSVGIAAALATLLGLLLMRIFRGTLRDAGPEVPPLIFPSRARNDDARTDPRSAVRPTPEGAGWADRAPAGWAAGSAVAPAPAAAAAPHAAPGHGGHADTGAGAPQPAGDVSRARSLEAPGRPAANGAPEWRSADAEHQPAEYQPAESYTQLVDARTVRFFRPVDRTMQLLPGRLEIVGGAEPGHVIRFVRIPGVPAEVTFGRSPGKPPVHVQLLVPTVSRRHARMRYADGHWHITNHSRTNPLVVNGVELAGDGESRALRDGDRIEMGEVTFVYRER